METHSHDTQIKLLDTAEMVWPVPAEMVWPVGEHNLGYTTSKKRHINISEHNFGCRFAKNKGHKNWMARREGAYG